MLDRTNKHALPLLCYPGRSANPLRPEEGLLVAVLQQAVGIFRRSAFASDQGGRVLFARIDAWFASDATDYRFAFVSICDALGLDASSVRSGLRQWRESRQEALSPSALRVVPFAGAPPLVPAASQGVPTRGVARMKQA